MSVEYPNQNFASQNFPYVATLYAAAQANGILGATDVVSTFRLDGAAGTPLAYYLPLPGSTTPTTRLLSVQSAFGGVVQIFPPAVNGIALGNFGSIMLFGAGDAAYVTWTGSIWEFVPKLFGNAVLASATPLATSRRSLFG